MSTQARTFRTATVLGLTATLGWAALVAPGTAIAATEPPPAFAPLEDCRVPNLRMYGEGFPIEPEALPATGAANVTTIYVDFDDAAGDPATLDRVNAGLDEGIEILELQSGGRLDLVRTGEASGWVRLTMQASAYAGMTAGDRFVRLASDAVEAVDSDVDFGSTDVLWVVFAPSTIDALSQQNNFEAIPSAEKTLTRVTVFAAENFEALGGWLTAHETGHTLGLPDLYDTEAARAGAEWIFPYTGGWDPMGDIGGRGREFFGWHLWRLQWIPDSAVSCVAPGTVVTTTLDSLGSRGESVIAAVPLTRDVVLVVESRQADRYDEFLEETKVGALVYRVDSLTITGHGPIQVVMPDGMPPFQDLAGSNEAPLAPGERYTDPSGVVIEALDRSDPADHEDVVRIDTRALAPEPTPPPDVPPGDDGTTSQPAAMTQRLPEMGARHADGAATAGTVLLGVGVMLLALGRFAAGRRRRPPAR